MAGKNASATGNPATSRARKGGAEASKFLHYWSTIVGSEGLGAGSSPAQTVPPRLRGANAALVLELQFAGPCADAGGRGGPASQGSRRQDLLCTEEPARRWLLAARARQGDRRGDGVRAAGRRQGARPLAGHRILRGARPAREGEYLPGRVHAA